jgi:hypothetical protein
MKVEEIVHDQDEAEEIWLHRKLWNWKRELDPPFPVPQRADRAPEYRFPYKRAIVVAFAKPRSVERYRFLSLAAVAHQLRFQSSGKCKFDVSPSGELIEPRQVVNFRRLTPDTADLLRRLWMEGSTTGNVDQEQLAHRRPK